MAECKRVSATRPALPDIWVVFEASSLADLARCEVGGAAVVPEKVTANADNAPITNRASLHSRLENDPIVSQSVTQTVQAVA